MNYAVIFTYSFDDDVAVYLFETEDEAIAFLVGSYKEELRIDAENGWDSEGSLEDDGYSAKITTYFSDHINVTEFRIGKVYYNN